ncbi:MAG: acyltransferase family protein, partial [Anaerolineales bacterium]
TGIGLSLTMLQAWIPPYPLAFNAPAWAMSAFVAFYAVFPALLNRMRSMKTRMVFLVTALIWVTSQLVVLLIRNLWYQGGGTLLHDFLFYNPIFHFNSFLVGMAAGLYFKRSDPDRVDQRWNLFFLVFSLLLGVAFIFLRTDIIQRLPFRIEYTTGLLSPIYALIILLLSQDQTAFSRFLSKPLLVAAGDLGLSIYLLQTPLVEMYKHILLPRLEVHFPWTADWHFQIYFPLLLLAAILARVLFEDPLQKLIRKKWL